MAAKQANRFAECTTVSEVLGQLAGAAATCWENGETPFEAPVFDSAQAKEFTDQAEERIKALVAQTNTGLFR